MREHNPENERVKRRYFAFLKNAKRHSEPTVDAVASALHRFEEHTKYRDFRSFHFEQAIAFKRHLEGQRALRSGDRLSKATLHAVFAHLKRFFQWLAGEPGYRSRLKYSDAEYFNLSDKDTRVATARREQIGPTVEQVLHVINTMPVVSEIERRNRALLAFTLLTGARDSAIASMKLKHVDLVARCVYQDARDVKTKFSKSFTTYFFRVGEDVRLIVADWVTYLRSEKLFGNDHPLFPATRIEIGENKHFAAVGLSSEGWRSATPIRTIFRAAFENAGMPYCQPHSFRHTLVRLGETRCQSPEQFKAWSQNLGHEGVLTTFCSYGAVASRRQGEIIEGLGGEPSRAPPTNRDELLALITQAVRAGNI